MRASLITERTFDFKYLEVRRPIMEGSDPGVDPAEADSDVLLVGVAVDDRQPAHHLPDLGGGKT